MFLLPQSLYKDLSFHMKMLKEVIKQTHSRPYRSKTKNNAQRKVRKKGKKFRVLKQGQSFQRKG